MTCDLRNQHSFLSIEPCVNEKEGSQFEESYCIQLAGNHLMPLPFLRHIFAGAFLRKLQTEALLQEYKSPRRVKLGELFEQHFDPYFRLYRVKLTEARVLWDVTKLMTDYTAATGISLIRPSHSDQIRAAGAGAPLSSTSPAAAAATVSSLRTTSAPGTNSSSSRESDRSSSGETWSHAAAAAQVLSKYTKRRVVRPGLRGLALHPGCLPGEGSGPIKQVVLGKGAVGSAAAARMLQHFERVSVIALDCEGGDHMAVAAIMVPAAGQYRHCYNYVV